MYGLSITPNVGWAKSFWECLYPLKEQIVQHEIFRKISAGTYQPRALQNSLLYFYPLVENFPKFMALNLTKVNPSRNCDVLAREWLIDNIAVEQKHARWWRNWGQGFGCNDSDFDSVVVPPPIEALTHYLWHVNASGSLVEGIGATNLAIEWATGEWAKQLLPAARSYLRRGKVKSGRLTLQWLRAHAVYDDQHPYEAMELIKACAITDDDRRNVFNVTKRSMEYYLLALNFAHDTPDAATFSK